MVVGRGKRYLIPEIAVDGDGGCLWPLTHLKAVAPHSVPAWQVLRV